MKSDESKKLVKKANKLSNPASLSKIALESFKTSNGECLRIEAHWATHLSDGYSNWIIDLFDRNMKEMYLKSQWGYDRHSKVQELQATTSRYLILINSRDRPVAFLHYRFVMEENFPVLYCYEIQCENDYQNQGIGTLLLRITNEIAQKTQLIKIMATVFSYNHNSLKFFNKNGFTLDALSPNADAGLDYLILSRLVM